jgi:hypothetical protein
MVIAAWICSFSAVPLTPSQAAQKICRLLDLARASAVGRGLIASAIWVRDTL